MTITISKLPMRQLTFLFFSPLSRPVSKLPMRQLTSRRDGTVYRLFSKLPMRQLTFIVTIILAG